MDHINEEISDAFCNLSERAGCFHQKDSPVGEYPDLLSGAYRQTNLILHLWNQYQRESEFYPVQPAFKTKGCPVPEIYAVNEEGTLYIQEDFGDISLLNKLEEHGYTDYVYDCFRQSLKNLANLQIQGDKGLDYKLVPYFQRIRKTGHTERPALFQILFSRYPADSIRQRKTD